MLPRLALVAVLLLGCDAKHEAPPSPASAAPPVAATPSPPVVAPRAIVPTGMPACDQMFKLYRDVSDCTKAPLEPDFEANLANKAQDWSAQPPEMKAGIEKACEQSVTDLKTQLAACQNPPPDEEE